MPPRRKRHLWLAPDWVLFAAARLAPWSLVGVLALASVLDRLTLHPRPTPR